MVLKASTSTKNQIIDLYKNGMPMSEIAQTLALPDIYSVYRVLQAKKLLGKFQKPKETAASGESA